MDAKQEQQLKEKIEIYCKSYLEIGTHDKEEIQLKNGLLIFDVAKNYTMTEINDIFISWDDEREDTIDNFYFNN